MGGHDAASPEPEVGSLYVDYQGVAYRLRADQYEGKPLYDKLNVGGAYTCGDAPEGLRLVWSPTGGPR